jgi:succinate dehydrogenase / fumarate reductase membrane anchor subunit
MRLRTPISEVRGLGSAKDGTKHWWAQRLTAAALVPLMVWFVVAVIIAASGDYEAARSTMTHPVAAGLWLLCVAALFYHAQLGLQVVIEDYVHHEGAKIASIVVMKLAMALIGIISIISVLKVALGS